MDLEAIRKNQYKAGVCAGLKQEADIAYSKALLQLTEALKAMQAVKLAVALNDETAGDRLDLQLGKVQKYVQLNAIQYTITAWGTNMGIAEIMAEIGVYPAKKRA